MPGPGLLLPFQSSICLGILALLETQRKSFGGIETFVHNWGLML